MTDEPKAPSASYAIPFDLTTEPDEPPRGAVLAYQRLGYSGVTLDFVSLRAGDGLSKSVRSSPTPVCHSPWLFRRFANRSRGESRAASVPMRSASPGGSSRWEIVARKACGLATR